MNLDWFGGVRAAVHHGPGLVPLLLDDQDRVGGRDLRPHLPARLLLPGRRHHRSAMCSWFSFSFEISSFVFVDFYAFAFDLSVTFE